MNYIEEEFLRQARAFTALLSGENQTRAEERRESTRRRDRDARSGKENPLRALPTVEAAERTRTTRRMEQLLAAQRMEETAPPQHRRVRMLPVETEGGLRQGLAQRGTRRGEAARRRMETDSDFFTGRAHFAQQTAGGGARTMKQEPSAAVMDGENETAGAVFVVDQGISAGELSRTFQRDARRYDGGYPLY